MRKRNWVWCWACMFLVVFASQVLAQELPDPTNPARINWTVNTYPGTFGTYFDLGFTAGILGDPGEYDVSITDADGNPVSYPAWCITNVWGVDTETPVNLYSTRFFNSLPAGLQTYQVNTYDTDADGNSKGSLVHSAGDRVPWNELNWLLNNRGNHSVIEVMYAIHRLMYGRDDAAAEGEGVVGEGKGLDLYNAALSHPDFIPDPGQVVAVMLYREDDLDNPPFSQTQFKQDVIIELPVPKQIHLKCGSCLVDAAKVGVPYSETMKVTGGVAPFTFSIVGGSLPDGLELNSSTGEIKGTPTKAGFYVVKIKVEDFQGNSDTAICLIIVLKPCIKLDCGDCGSNTGYLGTPFSHQLHVSGGVAPFTFSLVSGKLPNGLVLNSSTGKISGTPTMAGIYSFTVKVTDSKGTSNTASCRIVIKGTPLTLTCSSGCSGAYAYVGAYYSQALKVSGGTSPYTFSIVSGSLPPGLILNASTGTIAGKPKTAGTYNFQAKVVDSNGSYATVSCAIIVRGSGCK